MNCPLDLFVEDLIYNKIPSLRPVQLLSLFRQEQANVNAIIDASKYMPTSIVSLSKVLNMVTSMHFRQLYGIDFINEYKPTKQEYLQAKDLYEEYLAYVDTYKDGDEWELVEYFVGQTRSDDILKIVDENEVLQKKNYYAQNATHEGTDNESYLTNEEKEKQEQFNKTHSEPDAARDMMINMYMLGAMDELSTYDLEKIRNIAMEIAMRGIQGISPSKESGYSIPSLPGKDFSGYKFLAYYYVSWAIAIPEKVNTLGLPFKDNYDEAYKMFLAKGGSYPKY